MNGLNLKRVMLLRKCIKSITQIIRRDHLDYEKWADEIDRGTEQLFITYLDEPTQENYDSFGSYWFSTAPIVRQIIDNKR